jgi:catechol 2,3-dioxygenase-like lactoylglutathione lyase family enzyme
LSEPRLFRVALPVADIEVAIAFYRRLLDQDGERIGAGRHYFHCGPAILVCFDPSAEGHDTEAEPGDGPVFFAVEDLDERFALARGAGCSWLDDAILERGWGERSFYARDPFGNALCFVDARTTYTGLGSSASAAE